VSKEPKSLRRQVREIAKRNQSNSNSSCKIEFATGSRAHRRAYSIASSSGSSGDFSRDLCLRLRCCVARDVRVTYVTGACWIKQPIEKFRFVINQKTTTTKKTKTRSRKLLLLSSSASFVRQRRASQYAKPDLPARPIVSRRCSMGCSFIEKLVIVDTNNCKRRGFEPVSSGHRRPTRACAAAPSAPQRLFASRFDRSILRVTRIRFQE
jgi:hypothetical protein